MKRPAGELQDLGGRWGGPAQLVDAAVVGHPEQPRAEREPSLARAQSGVRADEHILQRVFGILPAWEHLPRVGQQPLLVAVVNDPERLVVPGPEEGDELLVRAQAKQRDSDRDPVTREPSRCLKCRGFHAISPRAP